MTNEPTPEEFLKEEIQAQIKLRRAADMSCTQVQISRDWWEELNRPFQIEKLSARPMRNLAPGQLLVIWWLHPLIS